MGKAEKSRTFLQECIEEIVGRWKKRRITIKRRWQKPFIFIECVCEWILEHLRNWAFLEIMQYIGHLAIIVAVIMFFMEGDDRQKEKNYMAWQVINGANGMKSSGGRISALEDLSRSKITLKGLDVSKAYLSGVDLKYAILSQANFSKAYLYKSNFSKAGLYESNFSGAHLNEANFSGAALGKANFSDANLKNADFSEAFLRGANFTKARLYSTNLSETMLEQIVLSDTQFSQVNLSGAQLIGLNLEGVYLGGANLTRAILAHANLSGVDFHNTNLRQASLYGVENWKEIEDIEGANIYGVINPPKDFVDWAKEHGAVSFPEDDKWESYIDSKRRRRGR